MVWKALALRRQRTGRIGRACIQLQTESETAARSIRNQGLSNLQLNAERCRPTSWTFLAGLCACLCTRQKKDLLIRDYKHAAANAYVAYVKA